MLQILKENKSYVKWNKCEFFSSQMEYLEFIVSNDGLLVDPKKIQSMVNLPTPRLEGILKRCKFL
jgi:hypothetical protein